MSNADFNERQFEQEKREWRDFVKRAVNEAMADLRDSKIINAYKVLEILSAKLRDS